MESPLVKDGLFYRSFFDSNKNYCYLVSDQGQILDGNPAALEILGYQRDELIDQPIENIYAPESKQHWLEIFEQWRRTEMFTSDELLLQTKAGQRRIVILSAGQILDTSPCRTFLFVQTDITEQKRIEEALRNSEQNLRYILKHDPNAIAVYDRNLHYLAVSERYLRDYNVREEEIIGKHHYEVFPEMPQKWKDVHRRCLAGAVESNEDDFFERPDGSITYNRWECRPWHTGDGQIGGIITYTEVTTERKQAEQRLRMMSELLDIAPSAITIHDYDGRFLYANRKNFEIHGYSESEFMQLNLHTLDVPESEALIEPRMKLIEEHGEARFEVIHVRKDGTTFPMEVYAKKVHWDGVPAMMSIGTDITERKQADNALQDAMQRLQLAVQSAHLGVWEWEVQTNTLIWDEGMFKIYGQDPESFCGNVDAWTQSLHPEDRERAIHFCTTSLDGQNRFDIEFRIIRPDGQVRMLKADALVMNDEHGRPKRMIGMNRDITEQHEAQNALRESENRFRQLFNRMTNGVAVYEARNEGNDFIFKDLNEAGQQIGKIDRDTVIGASVFDIYPAIREIGLFDVFQRVWRTGHPERHPMTLYKDNRIEQWVENEVYKLPTGEIVAIYEDVTARKQAEDALKKIEWMLGSDHQADHVPEDAHPDNDLTRLNKSRVILDAVGPEALRDIAGEFLDLLQTSTAVYETNGDYALGIFSSGWCRCMNQASRDRCTTSDDGVALNCGQWLCHESCWNDASKVTIETGQPVDIECAGGIRLYAVPIRAGDRIVGSINVGYGDPPRDRDKLNLLAERYQVSPDRLIREAEHYESRPPFIIDLAKGRLEASARMIGLMVERRQAEQEQEQLQAQLLQAQKMESVGRLAGGVAHDFNNMLGAILGHAEMALEQAEPDSPLYDDLREIQSAAQRSADLTRQLLAFARKQMVRPKLLNLNDTVSGMLKMLRRLIGEDIELLWKPGTDLWPVKIDPSQIDQILANLTVNARDAIEGVGKLTIQTRNLSLNKPRAHSDQSLLPGDYVLLAVSDTGVGIGPEVIEHLFEPFFTTKEVGKGTGLGLATVYGAVRQNNGFIQVHSEPGRGTTFNIYLPRASDAPAKVESGESTTSPGGTETVLLVEDEKAILRLGQSILERVGYRVLAADSPDQAIQQARDHQGPIHLLITDVVMPLMNGKDLTDRIVAIRPEIRVLYMSGYTSDVIAHHGVLRDGIDFLQKPFSMHSLTRKVRHMLDLPRTHK